MRLGSCLLMVCLLTVSLAGQRPAVAHWPRFRGPNGSGVSESDKPPTTFGPSSNRLWQAVVPPGHSSPTIWGDHIFVTAVENSTLVLKGTKKFNADVKDENYRRIERTYGTFHRSFTLPNTVDASRIGAEFKNGVLTVKLPFREEAKPRTINVEVAA